MSGPGPGYNYTCRHEWHMPTAMDSKDILFRDCSYEQTAKVLARAMQRGDGR